MMLLHGTGWWALRTAVVALLAIVALGALLGALFADMGRDWE